MPSPSKAALLSGLAVTAALFVAGAYAATYLAEPATPAQLDGGFDELVPSLAPGGNVPSPELKQIPAPHNASSPTTQQHVENTHTAQTKAPAKTAPPPPAKNTGLTVNINGVRNNHGNVYVLVFTDAKAYAASDYTKTVGYTELPAQTGTLTAHFPELNAGPYAVTLLHDENGDQTLNMDTQGYPVEGYGTSNATSPYEELQFRQALVEPGARTVKMHYLQ